jgi:hypothetical protein
MPPLELTQTERVESVDVTNGRHPYAALEKAALERMSAETAMTRDRLNM